MGRIFDKNGCIKVLSSNTVVFCETLVDFITVIIRLVEEQEEFEIQYRYPDD